MRDAILMRTRLVTNIKSKTIPDFIANGSRVVNPGWLTADPAARGEDTNVPKIAQGDLLTFVSIDPQKKQTYDQFGHQGIDQNYTAEDIYRGADFSSVFGGESDLGDILGRMFGAQFDTGGGSGRGGRRSRGHDIQY